MIQLAFKLLILNNTFDPEFLEFVAVKRLDLKKFYFDKSEIVLKYIYILCYILKNLLSIKNYLFCSTIELPSSR